MKAKFIRIALGAIGSIVTVLIQYYSVGAADPVLSVAGGTITSAMLGDFVTTGA